MIKKKLKRSRNILKPFPSVLSNEEENKITSFLDVLFQIELPHSKFKSNDRKQVIMNEINIKKVPGFDLISNKILKELSKKYLELIIFIFNAIFRLHYFPSTWKVA